MKFKNLLHPQFSGWEDVNENIIFDTLVAVAPSQSALSGDGAKWHTCVLHGLLAPTVD